MPINVLGFKTKALPQPSLDFSQPSGGPQAIKTVYGVQPVVLQPGQSFVLPAGQWMVCPGRYSDVQAYDQVSFRWRDIDTQPGSNTIISSDGANFRLANLGGTPVGATISQVGTNGNATNGYNTVTATISAGNSTWGTLVGGSLNTTVTVTTAGNYSLVPHLIWQPASNQTYPYIPPEFCCNLSGNLLNTVTVNYPGAGLTGAGTLTVVNSPGDTNPGGGVLTLNATLTNSGNLTAIWPLTQGTEQSSVPTFTFTGTGTTGMCANVIMSFSVKNYNPTSNGFNGGNKQPVTIISANGLASDTQNAALTGTSYTTRYTMPRMAWLTGTTEANSNLSNNLNITVVDGGKNLQAIPILTVICANANGNGPNGNNPYVGTANVGGFTDTSYIVPV